MSDEGMLLDGEGEQVEVKIETTLSKQKRLKCRQIVQEIKNFGVSQREILYLINLLSLELENRNVMVSIGEAIKNGREKLVATPTLEIPDGSF